MTKIAVVTGSAGNLGQAVVKHFIAENYRVVGTITSSDILPTNLLANKFEPVLVDLTSEENTTTFVDSVIKKYQRIDTAVLTVGGFAMGKIADTSINDIHKQYQLNFETAYNIARPVFMQMQKQNQGRIFLIGSRAGLSAAHSAGMIAYGFAKSLIFRLAELLNDEGRTHNVVTSVIVPGTIDTIQNRSSMPNADPADWVKPETIADIISFYCSDTASALREPVIKVYNNS